MDYEIRYFHADGSLGLIRMTIQPNDEAAADYAREAQGDFARFEIKSGRRALATG